MQSATRQSLHRPNLSRSLVDELRHRIVRGELRAGQRLNEVALSAELGVSRTPLREALTRLVGEGLVRAIPRKGFFVTELSAEEVREIYVVRQLLDPEALRLAGPPSGEQLARLQKLNERIRSAKGALRRIELDDQWHLLLLEHCSNRRLLALIREHMTLTRRYEYLYLREDHNTSIAVHEHEEILAALERGNQRRACAALRQNMSTAVEPLVDWLHSLDARDDTAAP